jgi:hypothetical protein
MKTGQLHLPTTARSGAAMVMVLFRLSYVQKWPRNTCCACDASKTN